MDPALYSAAMRGELHTLQQNEGRLHLQLTPNNNTLLHVLSQFQDSPDCVAAIINGTPGSTDKRNMLKHKNSEGLTALHIAATNGYFNVVQALIRQAEELERGDPEDGAKIKEEMLQTRDRDRDTALLKAIRRGHEDIAKLLVEEDPAAASSDYPPNQMGETPLYLAAETGNLGIVGKILATGNDSPAYNGPGGRTALQAAVISDLPQYDNNFGPEYFEKLLNLNKGMITKEVDEFGWSPLHYAARLNNVRCMEKLLDADASAAYITADNDENKTPFHVAACHGNVEMMKELLRRCPDCWEMTTVKHQNVLHLAVVYEIEAVLEFILANSWAANLINGKDDEGNTPLHLFTTSRESIGMHLLFKYYRAVAASINTFNGKNLTPLDMWWYTKPHEDAWERHIYKMLKRLGGAKGCRDIIQRDRYSYNLRKDRTMVEDRTLEEVKRDGETNLIVATLVATITFAAAFTLPDGYDGKQGPTQGLAVLARNAAFQAFVVSDAIAVIFSVCAVCSLLLASWHGNKAGVINRQAWASISIMIAMVAMFVAFMTGLYTVIAPSSLGLAITVCFLGASSMLLFMWMIVRKYCTTRKRRKELKKSKVGKKEKEKGKEKEIRKENEKTKKRREGARGDDFSSIADVIGDATTRGHPSASLGGRRR